MGNTVEIVVDARNVLGEGVEWSPREGLLYWVDIESSQMWTFSPRSGEKTIIPVQERVCSFAFRTDGSLLVARASGLSFFDPATRSVRGIRDLVIGEDGLRLNDGRCDRQGRFVVSEVDDTGRKRGRMFSTDGSLNPRPILDGINCGNSTCFRLDGTRMYFADTPERVIWEFDYDTDDGTPGNRASSAICMTSRESRTAPSSIPTDASGMPSGADRVW